MSNDTHDTGQETGIVLETKKVDLVPQKGVVEMAISVDELSKRMDALEEIKTKILKDTDFAKFKDSKGKEIKAIRKTGWLKFAVAFNLTTIVVKEEKVVYHEDTNKHAWHVTVQCIAPGGRITEEIGVCDNITDRPNQPEHVIKTMAKTRATSRAISGMVGAADTNADDMDAVKPQNDGPLCICSPENRDPSPNDQTFAGIGETAEYEGCLICHNCHKPISSIVSDSIKKKREESHT
jgi:hypothetical protein